MSERPLLAGIEAGGTKFVVAVARDPLAPLARVRVPTTDDPDETLAAVIAALQTMAAEHGRPAALGLASFGPLILDPTSPEWGYFTRTPKPGWSGVDIAGPLARALGCPVAVDTDVNGAALAEGRWGAGQGLASLAYITVGTGIGGGLMLDGRSRHGLLHPEIGHLLPRRHPDDDFAGRCPFHGDCLEGLASGPAILARLGRPLDQCAADHPFHAILADYLGQLCATLVLAVSVERVVIGGGVLEQLSLHDAIQAAMLRWLAGYVDRPALSAAGFVCPPGLGGASGLAGAFAMAQDAEVRAGVARTSR